MMQLPGPLTVTMLGRVRGLISPAEYVRYAPDPETGEMVAVSCVKIPTDAFAFMRHGCSAGRITVGPHPDLRLSADHVMDWYDDQRCLVDVHRVTITPAGLYIKGRMHRWWSRVDRRMVRHGNPSGDWRTIGGKLMLVGVILVYVPGHFVTGWWQQPAAKKVDKL